VVNSKRKPVSDHAVDFHTTHWSLVLLACHNQAPEGHAALAELCGISWYPLYAHVRRRGHDPEQAKDLTQSFFLHLIEHDALTQVDSRKGKFRSFLLASLNNFLFVAYRRENAGTLQLLPIRFVRQCEPKICCHRAVIARGSVRQLP
jgi:hypothetical protein